MLQKIQHSFIAFPERVVLIFEDKTYNYRNLSGKVRSFQKYFLEHPEISKKGIVAIAANNDIETYSAIFASLFCGITFVPINPDNPKDRLQSILGQSGASCVVDSCLSSRESTFQYPLPCSVDLCTIPEAEGIPEIIGVHENLDAYILFTSGSTGTPKGVPIQRKNIFSFIDAFFAMGIEVDENDRFLQMFDLTFDLSLMSYLVPVCVGASVYPVPSGEIKYTYIYSLFEDHQLSVALMVPSILSYLRPYFGDILLEKMRYSLFCGEALYEDISREWQKCVPNARIFNVYGPTEATIFCTSYEMNPGEPILSFNGILSIGKPMQGTLLEIVNEDFSTTSPGEKGELCLGGVQITPGYIKDPEKNAEAFFTTAHSGERFYRSGDLAFIDNSGHYFFLGRTDNQVKVQGGFRVELSEIEHFARSIADGATVVALSVLSGIGVSVIHLVLENPRLSLPDFKQQLEPLLPGYMHPSEYHELKVFPLNKNGKTDRGKIRLMIENNEI